MQEKEQPIDLLSPKNDYVFKQLFGDAQHTAPLAALLQATLDLPAEEFVGLTIADPNLNREYEADKHCILDVRITTKSGRDVDVEIQVRPSNELRDRIQCYVAQMVAEKAEKGEGYSPLPQSISIVILDHRLWQGDARRYHHRFRLYDAEAALAYPNSMEIHTLELRKIPKDNDGTPLWKWLRFISSKTQEEIMPLAEKDPAISEALGKLMHMSGDLATRRMAESRAKFLWDQAARERTSYRDGRKEGREEGIQENRLLTVRRMLRKNMTVALIAELTTCSLEEIEHLAKEMGD